MKPQYYLDRTPTGKASATIGSFPKRSVVPKPKRKKAKK